MKQWLSNVAHGFMMYIMIICEVVYNLFFPEPFFPREEVEE